MHNSSHICGVLTVHIALNKPSLTVFKRVAWFVYRGQFSLQQFDNLPVHMLTFSKLVQAYLSQTKQLCSCERSISALVA